MKTEISLGDRTGMERGAWSMERWKLEAGSWKGYVLLCTSSYEVS